MFITKIYDDHLPGNCLASKIKRHLRFDEIAGAVAGMCIILLLANILGAAFGNEEVEPKTVSAEAVIYSAGE